MIFNQHKSVKLYIYTKCWRVMFSEKFMVGKCLSSLGALEKKNARQVKNMWLSK